MTMFLVSPSLTTVAPLVAKDKGSVGNRVNCVASQALNIAGTGAVIAGTVSVADFAMKHKDKVSSAYNGVKNTINTVTDSTVGKKAISWVRQLGDKVKNSKIFSNVSGAVKTAAGKLQNTKLFSFLGKAANKLGNWAAKTVDVINKLPNGGKIAVVGAIALAVLNSIYKSGQIDQKYTDRAMMEKHFV